MCGISFCQPDPLRVCISRSPQNGRSARGIFHGRLFCRADHTVDLKRTAAQLGGVLRTDGGLLLLYDNDPGRRTDLSPYPPEEVYLSLLCHGVVYFCGCVTLKTEALCSADRGKLAVGVALVAVNAAVLRPFVSESGGYLIYILLDAAVVRQLLPQSIWALALPVYYCAVSALVLLTIRGFFSTNRTQYQRRLRLCVAKA